MAKKAVKAKPRSDRRTPAKRRAAAKRKPAVTEDVVETARLIPPDDGVTIRIYRIGHGDCHLLAFPGKSAEEPVYVLIDCGYKPGSPGKLKRPTSAKEICADIRAATGGHIHVAVITHEHQDHVNGISEKNFEGITIGEAWFAWTEDPTDDVAKRLRKVYKDKLVGLIHARNRLAADSPEAAERLDEFLAFELGGDDEGFDAGAALAMFAADGGSMNKRSMKVFKDLARDGVRFLRPHETVGRLGGTSDIRVFSLGPPRDEELLTTLDPEGGEEFHALALGASAKDFFTLAAAGENTSPFAGRYCISKDTAADDPEHGAFFADFYGSPVLSASSASGAPERGGEVQGNPEWRRIDDEWLLSAEQLALDMNDYTNNSSLVLAFELGKDGKVLLFPADAQRGNWLSWSMDDWKDGRRTVTAKDLLSRTVFYKVGHHGSHNATLNGKLRDDYPNLAWMGQGEHGREFTAMITAVRKWAETQKGWDHPLKAIKDALLEKASGRVFQTDTEFEDMKKFEGTPQAEWDGFVARTRGERLYFDYTITF
jgi:beta-lactamase superfamily II metal-dependent hydrolase